MKKIIGQTCCLILLSFFSLSTFAWDHSIQLGYGRSHDPNNTRYHNSGFLLTSDLVTLYSSLHTHWSITGALGRWYSSAPHNKNLTTAAGSLALRLYPFTFADDYPAYFLASFGPAYLSSRQFGTNTQGKRITIQSNLGFGAEFNCFDINLRLAHYSNANLFKPNEGFNILYLLSIGYLF